MKNLGTATYSPDDNKLRFYPFSRLSANDYTTIKNKGFIWAPKQELFVRAAWTPQAEDLLKEWCGEIEDEDKSLTERQEERSERYENLSEKKEDQANSAREYVASITDRIPLGQPILIGHHSERRARKDAERIENGMRKAVELWEASEYWKQRAAASLHHAKYKELPAVRARRIKTIEADKRKSEREKAAAEKIIKLWNAEPITWKRASGICNYFDRGHYEFKLSEYPRQEPKSQYEGFMSLWSALGGTNEEEGFITPEQARDLSVSSAQRVIAWADRWINHYNNRLTYERAMLGDTGGLPSDKVAPEVGGAVRCWVACNRGEWLIIQKVNKITVNVGDNWGNGGQNFTRKVEFDKIKAIMSREQVEKARADGRAHDNTYKTGFFLLAEKENTPAPDPVSETENKAKEFEAIKETLAAGVQVVTAPQLFPTPHDLAQRMAELAEIEPGQRILEPSAGTGAILNGITVSPVDIVAVEINYSLADRLRQTQKAEVKCCDFLSCNGDLGKFDRVLINPPFENGSDIKHIQHALTFLKSGGVLVAICANGPRQQRELKPIADYWEDLPEGTFKNQGTNVNTALLIIKD